MFSEDLLILALSWRQPGDALQLLMGNPDVEYSYKGCYSAIRRNDLLKHAEKWMVLKYTMVSKVARHKKADRTQFHSDEILQQVKLSCNAKIESVVA